MKNNFSPTIKFFAQKLTAISLACVMAIGIFVLETTSALAQDFPLGSLDSFELISNYSKTITVIERVEGSDLDDFSLSPGEVLYYDIDYNDGTAVFEALDNDNKVVQQIDLNNGDSADDLNMPEQGDNHANTIEYVGANGISDSVYTLADFDVGYINDATDNDGIDGGNAAKLTTEVIGTKLIVTIEDKR